MIHEHDKENQRKKSCTKKNRSSPNSTLSLIHKELEEEMLKIDMMSNISDTRKRSLKIGVIKTQVQIRRKVLRQSVPITFTSIIVNSTQSLILYESYMMLLHIVIYQLNLYLFLNDPCL